MVPSKPMSLNPDTRKRRGKPVKFSSHGGFSRVPRICLTHLEEKPPPSKYLENVISALLEAFAVFYIYCLAVIFFQMIHK